MVIQGALPLGRKLHRQENAYILCNVVLTVLKLNACSLP